MLLAIFIWIINFQLFFLSPLSSSKSIFIYVFYQFLYIDETFSCLSFTDCLSCNIENDCLWENGTCLNFSLIANYTEKNCLKAIDEETKKLNEKLCGNMNFCYNKFENINISLPSNNGTYGQKGLFCEYTITFQESKSLTISIEKKSGDIFLNIVYFNSNLEKNLTVGDDETYVIEQPKQIIIRYYSNSLDDGYDNIPFSIVVSKTNKRINIGLFSVIIFSAVIFIIVAVVVLICTFHKLKKRKLNQENNPEISNNQGNRRGDRNLTNSNRGTDRSSNSSISRKERELKLLENFISKEIIPEKFSEVKLKNKPFNNSCPIDLEDFIDESIVSMTKCSHLFHYNCITGYFRDNLSLPEYKCPICNTTLFNANKNNFRNNNNINDSHIAENNISNIPNNENEENEGSYGACINSIHSNMNIQNNNLKENENTK